MKANRIVLFEGKAIREHIDPENTLAIEFELCGGHKVEITTTEGDSMGSCLAVRSTTGELRVVPDAANKVYVQVWKEHNARNPNLP